MEKEILWADCKQILFNLCINFSQYRKKALEKISQIRPGLDIENVLKTYIDLDFGNLQIYINYIILEWKDVNNECWTLILKNDNWEFRTSCYSYPVDIIDSVPIFPYKVLRLKSWLDEE